MHLADAFIQSDLQCIQDIHLFSVCEFPGNWTHNLCAANAMLYHWATGTLTSLTCLNVRFKYIKSKCSNVLMFLFKRLGLVRFLFSTFSRDALNVSTTKKLYSPKNKKEIVFTNILSFLDFRLGLNIWGSVRFLFYYYYYFHSARMHSMYNIFDFFYLKCSINHRILKTS